LDGSVCFGSAFHNWALSIPYMKKNGITFKEIIDAYESGDYAPLKKKAPLHEVVLDAVIKHHPNPKEAQHYRIPKIWHGDLESQVGKDLQACNPAGKIMFVVTKVVVDPQAGEICTGRLFSGTMKKGEPVHLAKAKSDLRLQQIYIYNGAKKEIVDSATSGNIVGVGGLRNAYPGETVYTQGEEIESFEAITYIFEPVITKAIEAKKPGELPKLVEVLVQVSKEDPSVIIEINQETGEHLMHGMGELHLEVIENRIRKEKGMEVITSPPIVVYRETITKASTEVFEGKSPNKHNKFYFKVEPMDPEIAAAIKEGKVQQGRVKKKDTEVWQSLQELGMDTKTARNVRDIYKGNMLIDGTRGIVHIGEIIEMVMDMFEDVMRAGPIVREPCFNVKVILDDVKLHEDAIHRGPAQVYPAVRNGIRGAMLTARPVIFEPIQTMNFEAPADFMGEISKLIQNKRGQLLDVQQESEMITVTGKLPVGEMFGLASDLRSATEGRGSSSLVDQTFEKLPEELQAKVIAKIRERKGLKGDDMPEEE
jgi:elongation factor 2